MASSLDIRLVREPEAFSALRTEWNALLSGSSADTIFLTWEWLFSWWECYARPDDVLHIVVVRDGTGELIGLLPLYLRLEQWLPFKPIKILRFIGDGSWDSDYLDAILVQGRDEEILASVWKWLTTRPFTWHLLALTGIPETSVTCNWLNRISREDRVVSRRETVPCLVADLPDSWDDYLASLKPRFRTKIRSALRDITASYEVCFRSVQNKTELDASLQTLYHLHAKRWESRGAEGVFRNPAKRRFYERFTQLFLAQGWLAFEFLELNGNAVACQMSFKYRNTQFLLQEGFDPQFAEDSTGVVLRALVLKNAIQRGVQHYDFLAGLGRHKTQWQTRLKHCRTMSLGPRTIQNVMYLRLPVLMHGLRQRVKSLLPAKVLEIRRGVNAS